ncbi:hypothetical protein HDR66_01445 [bacterium]|nr:hypothetical protein [bacterium]
MKQKRISFSDLVRRAMVIAVLGGVCGMVPAARAASDGCDDENNNRITAELALCSVHAYNIGQTTNQSGAERQLMKDVIALKTTVITQQMNKQYEYLDSMIRRMKTQLEKAVLMTKLQAAGATGDTGSSSASSYSGGSYSGGGYNVGTSGTNNSRITGVYLDGAQNCGRLLDMQEMLNCLNSNYSVISNATNDGQKPTSEARQQLNADIKILLSASPTYNVNLSGKAGKSNIDCEQTSGILSKWVQECLLVQANNIRIMRNAYQQSNKTPAK